MALMSPSAGHQAALRVAEEVITRMGHLPQTQVGAGGQGCPRVGTGDITPSRSLSPPRQVEILPQVREMPLFKQLFTSWK